MLTSLKPCKGRLPEPFAPRSQRPKETYCNDLPREKSTGKRTRACGLAAQPERPAFERDLIKKMAFLNEIHEQEADGHGRQTNTAQQFRFHVQNLPEPALHGFGRGRIGQPFKDEHKADERDEKFHRRAIPESGKARKAPQRY